jgi:hypothetical protein
LPNIYEKVRKEIWGYAADEVLVLTIWLQKLIKD